MTYTAPIIPFARDHQALAPKTALAVCRDRSGDLMPMTGPISASTSMASVISSMNCTRSRFGSRLRKTRIATPNKTASWDGGGKGSAPAESRLIWSICAVSVGVSSLTATLALQPCNVTTRFREIVGERTIQHVRRAA